MTSETELHFPVHLTDVPRSGLNKNINGSVPEREALAKLLEIEGVNDLDAKFKITRWHKDGLKIFAEIRAEVVQTCVVSLEPVTTKLQESEEWRFKPEAVKRSGKNEKLQDLLLIDPFGEDPADLLIDGQVNLGALLVEHLCLMIDPFARSPSVEFENVYKEIADTDAQEDEKVSPFAALKHISNKDI